MSAVALVAAIWSGHAVADDQSVTAANFEGRYAAVGGGYGMGGGRRATVYGLYSAAIFDTGNLEGGHFLASIGVDRSAGMS